MKKTGRLALCGGTVVAPDHIIEGGLVLIEDGKIVLVGSMMEAEPEPDSQIVDASGMIVVPGLIDTHVHGSHGADVMTHGVEGIRQIAQAQLRYGTTSFLPTTISANHDDLLRALEDVVIASNNPAPAAEIIGIHIEGPFISPDKKGAQPAAAIREPNLDQCQEYLDAAPGFVTIMTLAPELPGAMELIKLLTDQGVIASLGHSEADYDTALEAMEAGADHATHLFNAMPGLHHRKPNLTLACLNEPGIRAEIILDGVHVAPEMAQLAHKAKGRDGLILITDAIAAVGYPDGIYPLGDSKVKVHGTLATLLDGTTIAGSLLTMNQAMRHALTFTEMSLADAVYAASTLPARLCGVLNRKGSLVPGMDADIAILTEDFSVFMTILGGEIVFPTPSTNRLFLVK